MERSLSAWQFAVCVDRAGDVTPIRRVRPELRWRSHFCGCYAPRRRARKPNTIASMLGASSTRTAREAGQCCCPQRDRFLAAALVTRQLSRASPRSAASTRNTGRKATEIQEVVRARRPSRRLLCLGADARSWSGHGRSFAAVRLPVRAAPGKRGWPVRASVRAHSMIISPDHV